MRISKKQRDLLDFIWQGRSEEVKDLLVNGRVDPDFLDDTGVTPLHLAVQKNDLSVIKLLIKAGADIYRQDDQGRTPLEFADDHYASSNVISFLEKEEKKQGGSNNKTVKFATSAGTRKKSKKKITEEQRDLLEAVWRGKYTKAKALLIDKQIDPNFMDDNGTTPLHEAVGQNDLPLIKLLIEFGADVLQRDNLGTTVLQLAESIDVNPYVIDYLKKKEKEQKKSPSTTGVKKMALTQQFGAEASPEAEALKKTFEAEKWVGKIKEMQQEWEKIPERLKKDFDFAAALSEARLKTLKRDAPGKIVLKKPDAPPPT